MVFFSIDSLVFEGGILKTYRAHDRSWKPLTMVILLTLLQQWIVQLVYMKRFILHY